MAYFDKESLIEFATRYLIKKKILPKDARYIADLLVLTDALGFHTHGLYSLISYNEDLGVCINPEARPVVVKSQGATAVVDGQSGMGQLSMRTAKVLGRRKALRYGIAMINVRNSGWIAALGVHLLSLAEEGFLARVWAQSIGYRLTAPHGGIDARMSTNPVAIAVPTDCDPILGDFAMSIVSVGKVQEMIAQDEKSVVPLFLDSNGNPSGDPKILEQGGTIMFLGGERHGYKGYALALWNEACAALAGGCCNRSGTAQASQSFCLLVVNPDSFAGRQYFIEETKRFIADLKTSTPRSGVGTVRVPGERAFSCLRQAEKKGIFLKDDVVSQLQNLARESAIEDIFA